MTIVEYYMWTVLFLVLISILDYLRRKHLKMANIPGPYGLPWLGSCLVAVFLPHNKRIQQCNKYLTKYGPVIVIWGGPKPFIQIANPEYAEIILSSSVHIDKGFLYSFLQPWLGTGLLTSYGEKWHKHRKMLTPTFHFAILNSFVEIFANNAAIMVKKLEQEVNKERFDIFPYLSACTLDIISEAAMGVKMNVQLGSSEEYIKNVHTLTEMVVNRMLNPLLYLDILHLFSFNYRIQKKCIKVLHEMSLGIIRQRIEERQRKIKLNGYSRENGDVLLGSKKKKAFLDLLLDIYEVDGNLTVQDIREEVDTFMFEGHDTTSAGVGWVIFCVGNHPEVQRKIFEELDDVFGDSDRPANSDDLVRLKYLECVIKEAMRLFPPVPILSRRLVGEVKIGDYIIPSNTIILIHIHHIHRLPKYFPNPDKFDPSRFASDQIRKVHPFAYIPFSAGPRNCIGQKFGMMEQKILVSSILRKYEIESIDKMDEVSKTPDTILRPNKGIHIKIKRRKTLFSSV